MMKTGFLASIVLVIFAQSSVAAPAAKRDEAGSLEADFGVSTVYGKAKRGEAGSLEEDFGVSQIYKFPPGSGRKRDNEELIDGVYIDGEYIYQANKRDREESLDGSYIDGEYIYQQTKRGDLVDDMFALTVDGQYVPTGYGN